jgi:hypothetical protein
MFLTTFTVSLQYQILSESVPIVLEVTKQINRYSFHIIHLFNTPCMCVECVSLSC